MSDRSVVEGLLAAWDPTGPGIAVAVIRAGEPTAVVCRGMASIVRRVPVTPSTVFSMASISKQFVCASILLLEIDGLLRREDDVRSWLPELPDRENPITIRHLMNNTSGLRDFEGLLLLSGIDFEQAFDHSRVMRLIVDQQGVVAPPGMEYLYCNTGFRMLAVIVERASGRRWDAFMRDRILRPLGMTRSHVAIDGRAVDPALATAYTPGPGGSYQAAAGLLPIYAVAESGESGLLSTLDDMARWATAGRRQDSLGEAVRMLPTTHDLLGGPYSTYGYGLFDESWRGHRIHRHGGGMPGMKTEILHLPEDNLSILCLSNRNDAAPNVLGASIAERLVGAPPMAVDEAPRDARFVDEEHGAVIDVRAGPTSTIVSVWNWDLVIEPLGDGRIRTHSTWLELEGWPPDRDRPPRAARLGGVPLQLVPVTTAPVPVVRPDLVGGYRSVDLGTTYSIRSLGDGATVLEIDGPAGGKQLGTLWEATPRVVLVGARGASPTLSLRGTDQGLVMDRAEVRGVPLDRIA